ncbi:MAG: hypothetical protein NTX25_22500 [Proteobacteria bacterium]|nr:hypothetical protein [Pseudomonadota bacterium]
MQILVSLAIFAGILGGCALNDPAQKVSVNTKVSASSIDQGEVLEVSWSSDLAKSCSIADNTGPLKQALPTAGKEFFTPTSDQTYTITCEPAIKGDKAGSSSVSVKLFDPPSATLEADKAQIYFGDQVSLTWAAQNAEDCRLTGNGKEIAPKLTLTGSNPYSPIEDTSYELLCTNVRGKKASAKTQVSVIAEVAAKPKFSTLAALDAAIDTQQMKTDCGEACAYADFSPDVFWRLEDGSLIGSPQYKAAIEKNLKAEPAKVALFTSKSVSFDFSGSFGYGHRDAVNDAAQQKVCEQKFPLGEKGARFSTEPEFIDELEGGREIVGTELLSPVAYDIEVSGKALRGVMKKDSEATFSYKIGKVKVQKEAAFTDFDKVKGSYRFNKDGVFLQRLSVSNFAAALASADAFTAVNEDEVILPRASFPQDGWFVGPPPAGVNGNNYFPEPTLKNYFGGLNPFQDGCQTNKFPYYQVCVKEAGDTLCRYDRAQPVNQKPGWQKIRSPRLVAAQGQVQCDQIFPEVVQNLGLGTDWVATAEQQYFVYDSTFPAQCSGANCLGKIARNGENDWRYSEVEPGNNRCINRWEGEDWNAYRATLQPACFSMQLYTDALKKKANSDNDAKFALECGQTELCKNAVKGMAALSDRFSPKMLSDILDREAAGMAAAKTAGSSYFITEPKLAPQFIAEARANLAAIEAGIETAQSVHTSNKSGWKTANGLVQQRPNVPGFDSYQESKDSIAAYKKELDRIKPLTDLDMREISCSYDAKGRFRSYAKPKVSGNVMLDFKAQNTLKTKVKEDTKISE